MPSNIKPNVAENNAYRKCHLARSDVVNFD